MSDHPHHVVPKRIYFMVFAALLVFTAITVAVAYVDLGFWSTPVALLIASVKAALVVLYFMHVRYTGKVVWAVVAASAAWLVLLLVGTVADHLTRVDEHGAKMAYERRAPAHEDVVVPSRDH
jgi:cytochrome c oxidase subunit IV